MICKLGQQFVSTADKCLPLLTNLFGGEQFSPGSFLALLLEQVPQDAYPRACVDFLKLSYFFNNVVVTCHYIKKRLRTSNLKRVQRLSFEVTFSGSNFHRVSALSAVA